MIVRIEIESRGIRFRGPKRMTDEEDKELCGHLAEYLGIIFLDKPIFGGFEVLDKEIE